MRRTPLRRRKRLLRPSRIGRPAPPRRRRPPRAAQTQPDAAVPCAWCGTPFHPRPRGRARPDRTPRAPLFCSRACARAHRAARERAAPSPSHTPSWWRAVSRSVLAIDGFRCVLCGASRAEAGRLHVDHVYPRRLFRNPTDAYRAMGFDAFATLCPSCHARKTALERRLARGDSLDLERAIAAIQQAARDRRAVSPGPQPSPPTLIPEP
jgi:5-methylcytosine-specific restriction endonuclease McrA